jgi:hypothetical protein
MEEEVAEEVLLATELGFTFTSDLGSRQSSPNICPSVSVISAMGAIA